MDTLNIRKKVLIYVRISTEGKYDMSLEDQKEILIKIAKDKGYEYEIFEEIQSGRSEKREQFNKMRTLIKQDFKNKNNEKKYDGIMIFKIDRFARNSNDFKFAEELLDHGYTITSATESIENTPTGRMLLRILASFSIYESEKLSNRQKLSRISNIIKENFKSMGGDLIFGYKINKTTGKIKTDPYEANIVHKIFNYYNSNNFEGFGIDNLNEIFNHLTEREQKILVNYKINSDNERELILGDNNLNKKEFRLIRNILDNSKNKTKYNGITERNIEVTDELVINYIEALKDKKEDANYQLDGENLVGNTVSFIFYFPELKIIEPKIYNKVILSKKAYNRGKDTKDIISLFNELLYSCDEMGDKIRYYFEDKKGNIYYKSKSKFHGKIMHKSEKSIEKSIMKSYLFKKIEVIYKNYETEIKEILYKEIISINDKVKRSKNGELLHHKKRIEIIEDQYKYEEIDIDEYLIEKKSIKEKIDYIYSEINILESEGVSHIEAYLDIFNKNFINYPYIDRKNGYKVIFKGLEIIIDNKGNKKLKLYISNFIQKLGNIPEIITISLM